MAPRRLKFQFQTEVDSARPARAGYESERGIAERDVRVVEVRRVGGAVPIGPEFKVEFFGQADIPEQCGIKVEETGSRLNVPADISEGRGAEE